MSPAFATMMSQPAKRFCALHNLLHLRPVPDIPGDAVDSQALSLQAPHSAACMPALSALWLKHRAMRRMLHIPLLAADSSKNESLDALVLQVLQGAVQAHELQNRAGITIQMGRHCVQQALGRFRVSARCYAGYSICMQRG